MRIKKIFLCTLALLMSSCSNSGDKITPSNNNPTPSEEIVEPSKENTPSSEIEMTPTAELTPTNKPTPSDQTSTIEPSTPVATSTSEATPSVKPSTPTSEPTPSEEIIPSEEESKVKSISLDKNELYVLKNKRSDSLIVNFDSDEELNDEDKEVIWSTLDKSIATVDMYGRVSGVEIGDTYVICETKIGGLRTRCWIHVVNSMDKIQKEYQLVEDVSTIKAGDVIVFGSNKSNKTFTNDDSERYLHSVETIYSKDKKSIVQLGEDTAEFMVDGETNNFTLENQNGEYLAALNLKKIYFAKNKGNIHWAFTEYDNNLYVESTSNVWGWLMYNEKYDRFTLYDREEDTFDLYRPNIYRLTIIR